MPKKSLSLDRSGSILKKLFYLGWEMPWETLGYSEEYRSSQNEPSFFDLSSWGTVKISGPDAQDYLQRMSTVDVKSLKANEVRHGAFLTGKGTVISLGMMFHWLGDYYFVLSPGQSSVLLEHLEKFHFAENLTVSDVSDHWALVGEWNPAHQKTPLVVSSEDDILRWGDDSRSALTWAWFPRTLFSNLNVETPQLGYQLFEFFRVQAGVPQVFSELSEQEIILEGNFEASIARNKGCYPGQEVVERIFTYGRVNKKLFPVRVKGEVSVSLSQPLSFVAERESKPVGQLVSAFTDPLVRGESLGLAFLHKNYWDFKGFLRADNGVTLQLKQA